MHPCHSPESRLAGIQVHSRVLSISIQLLHIVFAVHLPTGRSKLVEHLARPATAVSALERAGKPAASSYPELASISLHSKHRIANCFINKRRWSMSITPTQSIPRNKRPLRLRVERSGAFALSHAVLGSPELGLGQDSVPTSSFLLPVSRRWGTRLS